MRKSKRAFLIIAIFIAVAGLIFFIRDKSFSSATHSIYHLTVDPNAFLSNARRIGIDLSDQTPDLNILKLSQPAYLRATARYADPEFLEICKVLHASPWLAVPTTLTKDQYFDYGRYLAQQANKERFKEVYIEFDNENQKGLQSILEGADNQVNLFSVINDHFLEPEAARMSLQNTPESDFLAVYPDTSAKDEPNLKQILKDLSSFGKKLALYESPKSDASDTAEHIIQAMLSKIQPQIILNIDLSQEDPHFLAVTMLNKAILGSAHQILSTDANHITAIAFNTTTKWAAALVSNSEKPQMITLQFPNDNRQLPSNLLSLEKDGTLSTTASSIQGRTLSLTIPPHGLIVLPPATPASSQ